MNGQLRQDVEEKKGQPWIIIVLVVVLVMEVFILAYMYLLAELENAAVAIAAQTKLPAQMLLAPTETQLSPTAEPTLGQTAEPTVEPTFEPTDVEEELKTVTYTPPEKSVPLISNGELIGVFFVLNETPPQTIPSPYQSTTLIALGNGKVGDIKVSTDEKGTIGNIVTVLCDIEDGCQTEVQDYTPGHVGVTIIFAGKENPVDTVTNAVANMFTAPNCGASGCKTVNFYQGLDQETFTEKPASVKLTIPWKKATAQTAVIGEPPKDAKVIKIGTQVVGHSYVISGNDLAVSVPEGLGGTILYFPDGGELDWEKVNKGAIRWLKGSLSDSSTPDDLNQTVYVSGKGVEVQMIYIADLKSFLEALVTEVNTNDVEEVFPTPKN